MPLEQESSMSTATTVAPTKTLALGLDDLAKKRAHELEALYRAAATPTSLAALDGAPVGRMLAIRGLDRGPLAGGLRKLAASRSFVWGGKSFTSTNARS